MKNRIFAITILICLVLSLAACSKPSGEGGITFPTGDSTTATATDAPESSAPDTSAPETKAPVATISPSDVSLTNPPDAEIPSNEHPTEPEAAASIRGKQTDDSYINEMLNIRVAKPANWVAYTDEQIALVNQLTAESLKDTDVADLIGRNGQFTDMMMVTLAGNSINLILQPENALLDMYTDEQIFTLSADAMKSQFTAAGYSVETFEPVKMEIAGQERTILHMVLNAGGVMADEYQIWLRSDCDYMGILTVAILDGSDPQPILAGITALN